MQTHIRILYYRILKHKAQLYKTCFSRHSWHWSDNNNQAVDQVQNFMDLYGIEKDEDG
jgi:hypothetical protein